MEHPTLDQRSNTVASQICDQLAHWGIDRIFGVSGANIELVFDAAVRHAVLDAVLAKHESAAATMAIGWQERAGLPGVVATTSGGAAFNIVAPLTEALDSEIPLLALVGQPPTAGEGRGAFQDSSGGSTRVDAQAILAGAAVSCERVRAAARVPGALRAAAAAAIAQRGPAVLLLPRDVQARSCPGELLALPPAPSEDPPAEPSRRLVRGLTSAVHGLVPPLVIAGRGALEPRAQAALAELLHAWGAGIAVTPDAKAAVASSHPRFLGLTGVMGHPEVLAYAREARICVLAGTRLPDLASFGLTAALARTTIVSLNRRRCFPGLAGHPDVHELPGPLAESLELLLARTGVRTGARTGARTAPPPAPPRPVEPAPPAPSSGPQMSARSAIELLASHLEPGADVFVDAGNAGAFALHHLPSDGRGLRSVALGMGAMGHAFGAAIGACERTRRRTYVVAGDGSFFMHGMEIHTAVQRRLPVTFVILNNDAHAMCRLREERLLGGATAINRFRPARLADGLAAMLPGLPAAEAFSAGGLARALRAASAHAGPFVISVATPADEQPPFWPLAPTREQQEQPACPSSPEPRSIRSPA